MGRGDQFFAVTGKPAAHVLEIDPEHVRPRRRWCGSLPAVGGLAAIRRIGLGHDLGRVGEQPVDHALELLDLLRTFGREVVCFAEIVRQVVELAGRAIALGRGLLAADQLPIPCVGRGAVGPTGKPDHVVVAGVGGRAAEHACVTDAVFHLGRIGGDSGEVEERRVDVGAADEGVARGAGLDPAGKPHHERHAHAPLVERALAVAERRVVGRRLEAGPLSIPRRRRVARVVAAFLGPCVVGHAVGVAAVVAREDHDRVVGDPQPVERVEEPAEAFVDALEHRGHHGIALATGRVGPLGHLGRERLLVAPGPVDAVVPEVEEEGPAGVLLHARLHEPDRLVGEPVGDVLAGRAVGDRADKPLAAFRGRAARRSDAVGRKVGVRRPCIRMAVERHVEALCLRPVRLGEPEVPLAEVAGAVARVAECLGERVFGRVEEGLARGIHERLRRRARLRERLFRGGGVAHGRRDPVAGGVFAREQAGPRGGAERLGISPREPHALAGEAGDGGRVVILRAVGGGIHPAHVVHEEEDDVWLLGHGSGLGGRPRCGRQVVLGEQLFVVPCRAR